MKRKITGCSPLIINIAVSKTAVEKCWPTVFSFFWNCLNSTTFTGFTSINCLLKAIPYNLKLDLPPDFD